MTDSLNANTTNMVIMADMTNILRLAPTANTGTLYINGVPQTGAAVTWTPDALLNYADSQQNAILAGSWSFNVANASANAAHVVTTSLGTAGQFAMLKLKVWASDNVANTAALMPYSNMDYTSTSLTAEEALSLVDQTTRIDMQSYEILNYVASQIRANAITTTAQVDLAFLPLKSGH